MYCLLDLYPDMQLGSLTLLANSIYKSLSRRKGGAVLPDFQAALKLC